MNPYLYYEQRYRTLLDNNNEPLERDFLIALQSSLDNSLHLSTRLHHKDAPLYYQRYQNLIRKASKSLTGAILRKLESLTKVSSGRLKEATWTVLEDINAEFLILAETLHAAVNLIFTNFERHKDLPPEHQSSLAKKYFAIRTSLLHHFYVSHIDQQMEKQPIVGVLLGDLIKMTHTILKEERTIAARLFGKHFSQLPFK